MSAVTTSGQWMGQVEKQAARIRAQIASMTAYVQKAGGGAAEIERVCASYYKSLEKLYTDDFPIAYAIENSDLLLRYEGKYLHGRTPRLSLISSVFTSVRRKVGGVAYAISGLLEQAQKNKEVDLELSAYSTGSLYLGFNLPDPNEDEGEGANLLGENEPLYKATKEAIRTIGIVSQRISAGADEANALEGISDLLVRDTALAAVHDLAPSGQKKVESVMLIGRDLETNEFATLTPTVRKNIQSWLHKPIQSNEPLEFGGVIREIDLDIHRITIRRIENMKIQEIRCIYTEEKVPNERAREYVDKSVIVNGKVQRDAFGNPKLLQIETLRLKDGKKEEAQLL